MKKKNSAPDTLKNNFFLLKKIWKISPAIILNTILNYIIHYAVWVFYSVIFINYLFGTENLERTFQEGAVFIGFSMAVMFLFLFFSSWYQQRFHLFAAQKIHYHLNQMLFQKASNVDLACYENPEFYDNYTKAANEVHNRAMSVLYSTSEVVTSMIASCYVVGTMFSINIWAGFFAFMPMVGNFLFGKFLNQIYYQKKMDNVPYERRQDYVNRAVFLQKYAKELRLSNIFSVLKNTYETAYNGLIGNTKRYQKKLFLLESLKSILCFPLVFEGLWLFAAFSAMVTKTIDIGEFVVLSSAIVSTTWMLRGFTDSLMACYQNGLYIQNLRNFLDYKASIPEDQEGISVPETLKTLEFCHVSFHYEGSEQYALEDVSFLLKAGQKLDLVGHNGAGKSTLIKLIMRFYDPNKGEILLNGVNIKEYNLKEYRNLIGAVFQDFQVLSMSIAENVLMNSVKGEEEKKRAVDALKKSEIYEKIQKLPDKEDSVLTREFDPNGVVLSGGQLQKVAMARAYARNCPILLLDEPSSALDPIAEYQMYETIMKLGDSTLNGKKRMSFIISHRLSLAAMADEIYLMEKGRIIEKGTHKELMKKKGTYADMYQKQAENYLHPLDSVPHDVLQESVNILDS